ncbi:MAG: hypothetical protein IKH37_05040 [Prevotella sp.]|nr:hypothetical protein [Prevotella sp.]
MNVNLSVESYRGADGSSLSPVRCSQMVKVYEMLETMGNDVISYVDIQEEAARRKLFGNTKAKNAIRTFFPLLKKLDFVNYDGVFAANKCFTELGTQFVLACRALKNVADDTPHKDKIISKLKSIKRNAQQKGLVNMKNDPEWSSHNMWIALKLLKRFKILHWKEFLYTLHCIENGETIEDAIRKIEADKKNIDNIVFLNEANNVLPNTCYSYIRSFLEEAGLITKVSPLESKLLDDSDVFFSQIEL